MISRGLWVTHFILVNRIQVLLGTLPTDMMSPIPSILPFYREGKQTPEGTLATRLTVTTALRYQKCSAFSEWTWP